MQVEKEEQLEESSRRLIEREEDLFSYDSVNEEEEDELHKDFEALQLKLWMAINDTFNPSSSAGELKVLRSAMVSIQQQEAQDRRWRDCQEERVPRWRPQKCLSIHNILLQNMVEGRIKEAAKDTSGGTDWLSSPVKRQVSHLGGGVGGALLVLSLSWMRVFLKKFNYLLDFTFYNNKYKNTTTKNKKQKIKTKTKENKKKANKKNKTKSQVDM